MACSAVDPAAIRTIQRKEGRRSLEARRVPVSVSTRYLRGGGLDSRKGIGSPNAMGRVRARALRSNARRAARPARNVSLEVDRGEKGDGKMVAELEGVGKRFGGSMGGGNFSTRGAEGTGSASSAPNGAGRTTLLKLILWRLEPDEGSVDEILPTRTAC